MNDKSKADRDAVEACIAKISCGATRHSSGDLKEGLQQAVHLSTTSAGKKAFKPMADELHAKSNYEELGKAAATFVKGVGSAYIGEAVGLCLANVTRERAVVLGKILGQTSRYSRKMRQWVTDNSKKCELLSMQSKKGLRRESGDTNLLMEVTTHFFKGAGVTGVCSGAVTETRMMALPRWRIRCKFWAEYPSMLRLLVEHNPWLLGAIEKKRKLCKNQKLPRFEASVRSAMALKDVAGFDQDVEIKTRREQAVKEYQHLLMTHRYRYEGWSKEEVATIVKNRNATILAPIADFGDAEQRECEQFTIWVLTEAQFYAIIKKAGIKWTANVNPTECDIHDKGPQWVNAHAAAVKFQGEALARSTAHAAKLNPAATAGTGEQNLLMSKYRDAEEQTRAAFRKKARYERHLKQYENCR